MAYARIGATILSALGLGLMILGAVAIARGWYSRRPAYLALAGLCAGLALLNLLVGMPWVALPWALCVPIWVLHTRLPSS